MNVLNLLVDLNSVILIVLVANVFKPFIGSYAARKGENLATKEDIAQLTKIAEGIRAEISDKVWDRQKQWEMRRDVVFEVVRALGEMNNSLLELAHAYSLTDPERLAVPGREDLRTKVLGMRKEAREHWDSCNTKIDGSRFIADMVVGKSLGTAYYEYVNEMRQVSLGVLDKDHECFKSSQLSLSQKYGVVRQSVRNELQLLNSA
jgi:hypothetical protein